MNQQPSCAVWKRQLATLVDVILCAVCLIALAHVINPLATLIFAHPSHDLSVWMQQHHVTEYEHIVDGDEAHLSALPQPLRGEFDSIGSQIEFIFLAFAVLFLWFYHAYMEANTSTVGKRLFGLVVLTPTGSKLSLTRATVRLGGKLLLCGILFVIVGIPTAQLGFFLFPGAVDVKFEILVASILCLFIVHQFGKRRIYDTISGSFVVQK